MKKTEGFWTIFATLTGGQKFTVIRNILVLPILLIAVELGVGGGLYGIVLFPWIALPFYLWSNVVRGKTLHRLHLPGGFLTRPSKLWAWYLIAGVVGAAYSAAWIGISAAAGASELVMVHVNNVASGFLAAVAVILGIRRGWSDVIPADQADAVTQGQQVLHLINPKGIAQRQLFFNIAGVLIFIGALAQVGQSMARIANTGTSAAATSTDDDALVNAMADGSTLPAASDARREPPTQGISDPEPTPGLSLGTYGNQLVSHYPGQSPLNAATYALRYLKVPYQLGGIDAAGYVSIEATCEGGQGCDIYLSNGQREHTANIAGFAGTLWPVNPADVQIALTTIPGTDDWLKVMGALAANKIACMGPICFDKAQHVVGRATQQTLASEVSLAQWKTAGQSQQAAPSSARAGTQPASAPSTPAPAGPSGLTPNTYGNRVTSFYPGKAPLDAYVDALSQIHSYLSVGAIDYLGYPSYDVECEKNGQCYGGEGAAIGSMHDVAGEMFPVDPADISRYRLSCHVICYDSKGDVIGRDPDFKG